MSFREAGSFHEVREYVTEQIELFSCFSYDDEKFEEMAEDFASGEVKYFISDDMEFRGYVRIINIVDDFEDTAAAIDIIIPSELGENRMEDLSEILANLGYDKAFLNAEIPWITDLMYNRRSGLYEVELPELNVSRHFEEGTGTYRLINIIEN